MLNTSALNTSALNAPASGPPAVQVDVYQGVTLVATRTLDALTATATTYPLVFTGPELALITNPADLTVTFTHLNSGAVRVTEASLELVGTASGTFYAKLVEGVTTVTAVTRQVSSRALAAMVTAAGEGYWSLARRVSGTVTAAAAVLRRGVRGVSAVLASAATLLASQAVVLVVTATLAPAGARRTLTAARRLAAVGVTATVIRLQLLARTLGATVESAGRVQRQGANARSAAVTVTALVTTNGRQLLTTAVTLTTTQARRMERRLGASVAGAGRAVRRAVQHLSAASPLTASLLSQQGLQLVVVASVSAAAALGSGVHRRLFALVAGVQRLTRRGTAHLEGVLAGSGAAGKRSAQPLSGALTGVGALVSQTAAVVGLTATVAVTASQRAIAQLVRQAGIVLQGVLDFVNEWSGLIRGTLALSARYEGTVTIVIPGGRARVQPPSATGQVVLPPATVQIRQQAGTGQVTPPPATGTLLS